MTRGTARGSAWVPCATAFVASACVMVVELLAFRLVTRFLGSSNYTTTAIIGVVLGGLALGNYAGGRIADRFRAGPTLSTLFILASAGCFAIPVANNLLGEWSSLWFLSWPARIAIHVLLAFFVPCALLGTIGPVVAKMALDCGREVGRTVGGVYAWGVLGSILGTFATGFYLIPRFGLFTINHVVAAILAAMAICFAIRRLLPYAWATTTLVLIVVTFGLPFGPASAWARTRQWAADVGLRDDEGPEVLFDRASEYSQVRIEELPDSNGRRVMLLDKLAHSFFNPNTPNDLLYGYERVFAAVTEHASRPDQALNVLILGGGGFTHPRALLRMRPAARVQVVEIDPVVTEAAREAFGLTDDPRMQIVHLDARQRVMSLLRAKRAGQSIAPFDFIFLDAINDFIVPPHLTTREFVASVKELLAPDGVYMLNSVDILDVGAFLASETRTLQESFRHVACYYANEGDAGGTFESSERNTFVLVASDRELGLDRLGGSPNRDFVAPQRIGDDVIRALLARHDGTVLTDDHAPVEYMLESLPIRSAARDAKARFYNRANREAKAGRYERAIEEYQRALSLDSKFELALLNLGMVHVTQADRLGIEIQRIEASGGSDADVDRLRAEGARQYQAAIDRFRRAIEASPESVSAHFNLAQVLSILRRFEEAAVEFRRCVQLNANHVEAHYGLAMALANHGKLSEAMGEFQSVLRLAPDHATAKLHLARIQEMMTTSRPVASQAKSTTDR